MGGGVHLSCYPDEQTEAQSQAAHSSHKTGRLGCREVRNGLIPNSLSSYKSYPLRMVHGFLKMGCLMGFDKWLLHSTEQSLSV